MAYQTRLMEAAARMGVAISPAQAEQFEAYHRMLAEANRVMNLTRVPDDEAEAIDRNDLDSVAPLAIPGMMDGVRRMIDVGTGAGFPGVPLLIGWALDRWGTLPAEITEAGATVVHYDYTVPMLIFLCLGLLAVLFGFLLKREDKKKGYGLQKPNIEK